MSILVATDLDRTLIYSRAAIALASGPAPELVCVEVYDGAPASFMTSAAAALFAELRSHATVVPVTTRTVAQLRRVTLPGPHALDAAAGRRAAGDYSVAANGGVLLHDGVEDGEWNEQVAARVAESAPLTTVLKHLGRVCHPEWTLNLREANGLFCYVVVDRVKMPAGLLAELTDWSAGLGWWMSLQGRKLYCVPRLLTKSAAISEIAARTGAEMVLAAGDSLLDADLLLTADEAIMPRHGELFDTGWSAPQTRLTDASGMLAGEEIVSWLLSNVRQRGADRGERTGAGLLRRRR